MTQYNIDAINGCMQKALDYKPKFGEISDSFPEVCTASTVYGTLPSSAGIASAVDALNDLMHDELNAAENRLSGVASALDAIHARGILHRDVKPSNVFLCREPGTSAEAGAAAPPLVKVFDFGVAKLDDDDKLTRTDAVMGTAAYMAPEQARSAADAGPLADVYSTSAVLYHMLCGQPPYGNVPAFSRLALVLHEEPARPRAIEPSIPAGIEAVI